MILHKALLIPASIKVYVLAPNDHRLAEQVTVAVGHSTEQLHVLLESLPGWTSWLTI